jgi:hypothetical protein
MGRTYSGNHEGEETGWIRLGEVGKFENVKWVLYRKPQPSGGEWDYIKLVANGRVVNKANYWLSWNGARFAMGGDFSKLAQHRNELCDMVVLFMEEFEDEQAPYC